MTMLRTLLLGLSMMLLPLAPAAARDEAFAVRQASLQQTGAGYYLNALIDIRLPPYIRQAVEQGFDLPLMFEVEVYRERRWLWDKLLYHPVQRYRLSYRSFYDAVRVLDQRSGEHRYLDSLDDALSSLSVIFNYPLLEPGALEAGETYRLRLRYGIDQQELPLPLKSTSLWQNDWGLSSDWYEWEYRP